MDKWSLPPEVWRDLREQLNLRISDAESCALVIAGQRGSPSAEFLRLADTVVKDWITLALQLRGCPGDALERAGNELLVATLQWREDRDALLRPTEGAA